MGTAPNTGFIMKPKDGHWGNDLTKLINDEKGFWIEDTGSATWVPNPVGYAKVVRATSRALPTRRHT